MKDEIRALVNGINEAWRAGRFAELGTYFHAGVIAAHPRFEQRTAGREALIVSYAQFAAAAHIHEFTTGEIQVDSIGAATAVAVTPWRMKYDFESKTYDEQGWDLMVFAAQEGAWLVVWRTMIVA